MDLLARLSSTGIVKSPSHMTPEKFEALELLESTPGREVVLTRNRGKEPPPAWHHLWDMHDAGWVEHLWMKRDDALGQVFYAFRMTDVGYMKWLDQKGVPIPPPPPAQTERVRRRRGPAAKTGKPGL